jgi:DNA topoisomerase-1
MLQTANGNIPELDISDLSHREILQIDRDYQKAAEVADLEYVNVSSEGITRVKKGTSFSYLYQGKVVKDKSQLERIRKLVIPPAWKEVWICVKANGHIQATGLDMRGRKQYRYHPLWNALRDKTKFHRLYEFGKVLPKIRARVEQDFNKTELCQEKVLALVVSLMERTYIRIGNSGYEKLYGSYGLTTLKDKHVAVEGSSVKFCFKGKKGVEHTVTLRNKKLANTIRACREIPGKELFQYFDADGSRKSIDSGMVNQYIKEAAGGMDFTAKDFRTWAGSLNILWAFKSIGDAGTQTECKKKIVEALDEVSQKLGNTRTVCRKYYVHPELIKMYEENSLRQYIDKLDEIEDPREPGALTCSEQVLMKILGKISTMKVEK